MLVSGMAFSFHTHTLFCDGKADATTMARTAFEHHYTHLGFSAHAPISLETDCNLPWDEADSYVYAIRSLAQEYEPKGMKIFLGLETEYVPGIAKPDDPAYEPMQLDYRIGSVHYVTTPDEYPFTVDEPEDQFALHVQDWVPDGDYRKIWKRYWCFISEMIEAGGFDIIGHFDLVKKNNIAGRWFDEENRAYTDAAFQAVDLAAEKDYIAEINTGGIARSKRGEPYPSVFILKRMQEKGIRITIGDDAHTPSHIGVYQPKAMDIAEMAGYKTLWYMDAPGVWKEVTLESVKAQLR